MSERFRQAAVPYRRVVITVPTSQAVSLAEVRERLRLGQDDADADIQAMVDGAAAWWEATTGCSLMPQVAELQLDAFPAYDHTIPLLHNPVRAVVAVDYTDAAGDAQVWPAANYQVVLDKLGGRLRRLKPWPRTQSSAMAAVRIRMEVGYANAAGVPADIKDAIMLHVGARYRNREALAGTELREFPMGAADIAARYRLGWLSAVDIR